jgi:TolB-like protein/Flp pilus assembly protein TadD
LRFLLVAVVLIVITATFYAVFFRPNRTAPTSPINSIVVLPLDNLSGDPTQEYFADGMTDAVIGELARIRSLHVISRTSAIQYRGTNKTLPEIARELNVEAVVEGTVLRFGDRVQVRVQLIRAQNDQHLWSETYDYDLRDVLALQSEVARAVAREIQIKITPDEQARLTNTRSVNRKAYDDYLLGIYHWNRRSATDLHKAIDDFQSAIREDETYAPAYAALADCYIVLAGPFSEDPRENFPKAKAYVTKALEIDGTLAQAHTVLASILNYEWETRSAEQEYKRAIELDAGNSMAHARYARFLSQEGRFEESVVESKRALESDPVSLIINSSYGYRLYHARRYGEAEDQLMKALDLDPNFFIARMGLGEVYAQTGRYAESVAEFNKAAGISRIPALPSLGYVYAISGRGTEAHRVLAELHEAARWHYVSPVDIAEVYAGLGDKNQAFNWLEKAYQERTPMLLLLNVEAKFDSLRKDPRFDDLLRRISRPQ